MDAPRDRVRLVVTPPAVCAQAILERREGLGVKRGDVAVQFLADPVQVAGALEREELQDGGNQAIAANLRGARAL